jgi:hypothetical protein
MSNNHFICVPVKNRGYLCHPQEYMEFRFVVTFFQVDINNCQVHSAYAITAYCNVIFHYHIRPCPLLEGTEHFIWFDIYYHFTTDCLSYLYLEHWLSFLGLWPYYCLWKNEKKLMLYWCYINLLYLWWRRYMPLLLNLAATYNNTMWWVQLETSYIHLFHFLFLLLVY